MQLADQKSFAFFCQIAYNLLDACKRYSYDADIELFRKVMDGDISEKVLRSQLRMLHEIKQGIQATAVDEAGTAVKGAPTKEQVLEVVKNHPMMKFQRESAYDTLREKLDLDAPKKGPVDCNKLFEEDSEGNQTGFVEALRDLNLADREEYFDQLEEAICSQEPEGDNDGRVNVLQLRAAVAQIDPNKSPEDVDALLRLGLMMEKTVEVEKEELDEEGNVVGTTMERRVVERLGRFLERGTGEGVVSVGTVDGRGETILEFEALIDECRNRAVRRSTHAGHQKRRQQGEPTKDGEDQPPGGVQCGRDLRKHHQNQHHHHRQQQRIMQGGDEAVEPETSAHGAHQSVQLVWNAW